jgi:hypothetical protein
VRSIGVFVGIAFAMVSPTYSAVHPFMLTWPLHSDVFPGSQHYKLL